MCLDFEDEATPWAMLEGLEWVDPNAGSDDGGALWLI